MAGVGAGRFSLALASAAGFPVLVDVSVLAADGRMLDYRSHRLPGYTPLEGSILELPDVFGEPGTVPCDGCRVEVGLPPVGPVVVWGALVDDAAGDAMEVPAILEETNEPIQETLRLPHDVPISFVRLPSGDFAIGSPEGEPGRDGDETRHAVHLSRPYLVGRTEVTEAQWDAVMGGARTSSLPAVNVS
jgi:hypothetical protein